MTGSDQEGITEFKWKLSPTLDYDKFQLDVNDSTLSATNVLRFKAAPDFENPLDGPEQGDRNNTYAVQVQMHDALIGEVTYGDFIFVIVDDDNDMPFSRCHTIQIHTRLMRSN